MHTNGSRTPRGQTRVSDSSKARAPHYGHVPPSPSSPAARWPDTGYSTRGEMELGWSTPLLSDGIRKHTRWMLLNRRCIKPLFRRWRVSTKNLGSWFCRPPPPPRPVDLLPSSPPGPTSAPPSSFCPSSSACLLLFLSLFQRPLASPPPLPDPACAPPAAPPSSPHRSPRH